MKDIKEEAELQYLNKLIDCGISKNDQAVMLSAFMAGWDKASERLEEVRKQADVLNSVLCDPDGKVSITGSEKDSEIIQEALDFLKKHGI